MPVVGAGARKNTALSLRSARPVQNRFCTGIYLQEAETQARGGAAGLGDREAVEGHLYEKWSTLSRPIPSRSRDVIPWRSSWFSAAGPTEAGGVRSRELCAHPCQGRYTQSVSPATRPDMTVRRFESNAEADRHDAA